MFVNRPAGCNGGGSRPAQSCFASGRSLSCLLRSQMRRRRRTFILQATGELCLHRSRGGLTGAPAWICDPSRSLVCQTATAALNAAHDTHAAFHSCTRCDSHRCPRACVRRCWNRSDIKSPRWSRQTRKPGSFECFAGVAARMVACAHGVHAMATLTVSWFCLRNGLDRSMLAV